MSKFLFLTTAHYYNDDRIFFHQAKELQKSGHEVFICSLSSDFKGVLDGIQIDSCPILEKNSEDKINEFLRVSETFQPDCIIASEPLAVFAAHRYKKKKKISIVYDITEWYPAMSMLRGLSGLKKYIAFLKFSIVNIIAGFWSTHFIFGEETKKFPIAYLFPFKKQLLLSYYPHLKYVEKNIKTLSKNQITLAYTGALSEDKGIGRFFRAIREVEKRKPNLEINLIIVGAARSEEDQQYFSKLMKEYQFKNVRFKEPTSFETFTRSFSEAHLCFDLRGFNFENHHSLPIKLFYYIGAGKPIIYSRLKGIEQHMDVSSFGHLVNPENAEEIAEIIINYTENPTLYDAHALSASNAFKTKYNWEVIAKDFVRFVEKTI